MHDNNNTPNPLDYPLSDTIALLMALRMISPEGRKTVDLLTTMYPTPFALVN